MAGRLYVVGVGPGDPELLTLKGARILNQAGCICVPKGKEEGTSLALSIVERVVDLTGKEIVEAYFPMVKTAGIQSDDQLGSQWAGTVAAILDRLDRDIDTAFITIGDPGIYSTFFYIRERLLAERPGLLIEIVPGISSINASAALTGFPLGLADERIAVLPANYLADLDAILGRFDTVVLMKVYKVFEEVLSVLDRLGLLDQSVYVSRAGLENERVCGDLRALKPEELDYFSLIIVRKGKRG